MPACVVLLEASGVQELRAGRGSTALSQAADATYPFTPTVRNEMLNRTALTSQGAKARRLLLKAMIERGSEPGLGLDGYGPEVAMYRAFLERTGLHGDDSDTGAAFRMPTDVSLQPAWRILEGEFMRARTRRINLNDIYAALLSPPVGMKASVIPVFVTSALLAFSDEIAIYEHGTFIPLLTTEMSERMVRNPRHFDVKHFANTTGGRQQVVDALAATARGAAGVPKTPSCKRPRHCRSLGLPSSAARQLQPAHARPESCDPESERGPLGCGRT